MARGVARVAVLLLLLALTLAVPLAGGRTLATTTLVVQVLGDGEVVGGASVIDCGGGSVACYATPTSTGSLTLTASPRPGWTFSGWDGTDCGGTLPTCVVPMDGLVHEEIAEFAPLTPAGTSGLTVTASTGGSVEGGDVDCVADGAGCSTTVPTGSTITLLETPDTGYSFNGWNGSCSGASRACTIRMDTDSSVSAVFTLAAATRILTVSVSGGGTVSGGVIACTPDGGAGCTANETLGTLVTLTATPDAGKEFVSWGGDCSGSTPVCTLTMTSDRNVTATFSGGSAATATLTVTVSGSGSVRGGGIDCGGGASTCRVDVTVGTRVTLTAAPASGATFEGWGGACSGKETTCSVTMSAARTVSASFAGGTSPSGTATLTLHVRGKGSVATPAGRCDAAGGSRTCSHAYGRGTQVVITAEPGKEARFVGWSGACTGATPTCTVVLSAAKTVTATFTGTTATAGLRSSGRPLVERAGRRFEVVLRFSASRAGTAHLRALRAGRVAASFSFTVAAGAGRIGPFQIRKPGYYTFELGLGERTIRWTACLGRCGAAAPGTFAVAREPVKIARAGALWALTVRFHASLPSEARLRLRRGGNIARDYRFLPQAGSVSAGPFLLSPGTYTIRLRASDAYGRVQRLTWVAFLS